MRVLKCESCKRTVEESHILWDEVRINRACPFCRRPYNSEDQNLPSPIPSNSAKSVSVSQGNNNQYERRKRLLLFTILYIVTSPLYWFFYMIVCMMTADSSGIGYIAFLLVKAYPFVTVIVVLLAWWFYMSTRYKPAVQICWIPAAYIALTLIFLILSDIFRIYC